MADYDTIRDARQELVLAPLHMAALFAPMSTPALTTIEDPATGDIVSLPGYRSAGLIEKQAGTSIINDIESTDIEAYGFSEPVRTIINRRTVQFQLTFLETNITVLEQYWGRSFSDVVPSSHGGVVLEAPSLPKNIHYRLVLVGMDDVDDKPLYPFWIMPKVRLQSVDNQELRDDGAVTYSMTFQAYRDEHVGFAVAQGWCGPGWLHLVSRAGFVDAPTALTVTPETIALNVNETEQLVVTGNNGLNYTPLATYTSSDPSKVLVDAKGEVKGVAAGNATINIEYLPAGTDTPLTVTKQVTVS